MSFIFSSSAPAPPPPPLPAAKKGPVPPSGPKPPVVAPSGPTGSFMVELMIYNGSPFKDHWAFWDGFKFEISRSHEFDATKRIPLQWVDGKNFDEAAMLNNRKHKIDNEPVCAFEASVHKVKAPERSLNPVDERVTPGRKICQRNRQTWIVEAADQLVKDDIFNVEVASYLQAAKQ